MDYEINPDDRGRLARFRNMWRAAGWGADAEAALALPSGHPRRFYAALFSAADVKRLIDEDFEEQRSWRRSWDPLPVRSAIIPIASVMTSPNLVWAATAPEVCVGAIRRATEIYGDEVPRTPADLQALARQRTDSEAVDQTVHASRVRTP